MRGAEPIDRAKRAPDSDAFADRYDAVEVGASLREARILLRRSLPDVARDLRIRHTLICWPSRKDVWRTCRASPIRPASCAPMATIWGSTGTVWRRTSRKARDASGDRDPLQVFSPIDEGHLPTRSIFLLAALLAIAVYGVWYFVSNTDGDPVERVAALPDRLAGLLDDEPAEEGEPAATESCHGCTAVRARPRSRIPDARTESPRRECPERRGDRSDGLRRAGTVDASCGAKRRAASCRTCCRDNRSGPKRRSASRDADRGGASHRARRRAASFGNRLGSASRGAHCRAARRRAPEHDRSAHGRRRDADPACPACPGPRTKPTRPSRSPRRLSPRQPDPLGKTPARRGKRRPPTSRKKPPLRVSCSAPRQRAGSRSVRTMRRWYIRGCCAKDKAIPSPNDRDSRWSREMREASRSWSTARRSRSSARRVRSYATSLSIPTACGVGPVLDRVRGGAVFLPLTQLRYNPRVQERGTLRMTAQTNEFSPPRAGRV